MIELAQAIATRTNDLSLVFTSGIRPQRRPRLPDKPCAVAYRAQVFAREEYREGGTNESHSDGAGDQIRGAVSGDVSDGGDNRRSSFLVAAALTERQRRWSYRVIGRRKGGGGEMLDGI